MKPGGLYRPVGSESIPRLPAALAALIILITTLVCKAQQISANETVAHQAVLQKLVLAAIERTRHSVRYVSSVRCEFPIPGATCPRAPAFAPMKSFASIAPLVSIFRRSP